MSKRLKIKRRVIPGEGQGRKLGFPTANLQLYSSDRLKRGVWATVVNVDGRNYLSVTFVGKPLGLEKRRERIEVFVFNYQGDLYDREVELGFIKWLRSVKKFVSTDAFVEQIKKDCQQAKEVLINH